jgi:orotidine-5'-phosphate decarboxylase
MNFSDRLRVTQRRRNSLLCVGLDTDLRKIPRSLRASPDPVLNFNRQIISATRDLVCAYKINLAFYEAMGRRGWQSLQRTLSYIPDDVVTIGDAKRGDIGNSSTLYARALFKENRFTACTVNPYMGRDSVAPFLEDESQGVFVLALTSNPGARDFQHLKLRGAPLYEHVVRAVKRWNEKRNCGLVVGATRPKDLRRIREIAPHLPILIPGVGAQGGSLRLAVRHGCDSRGELAVINSSRGILYASGRNDFAEAARNAALAMRDEINGLRAKFF